MSSPFAVLDVSAEADDAEIKAAYLQQVRAHPPERDPIQFQRIREAFEALQDRRARLRYRLFQQQPPSLDELAAAALRPGPVQRPDAALFEQLLAEGLGLRR